MVPPSSNDRGGDPRATALPRALLDLARARVLGGSNLATLFRRETELVAHALGIARVGIWLFDDEHQSIRCHQLFERATGRSSGGTVLLATDFPTYFRALEAQRQIAARDVRDDPVASELRDAYFEPLGISSTLDAPLYRAGEVVGVVCHEHVGAPRAWTEEEKAFAASVADRIAMQLEEAARHDAERLVEAHEQHLAEIDKMEALGRLAAGVAHDFSNLLTIIMAAVANLEPDAPNDLVRGGLADVKDAARRGVRLVRELLAFGRGESHLPQIVDLGAAIEPVVSLVQRSLGAEHKLVLQRTSTTSRVLVDVSQFERLLLNLVLNAKDAMAEGGAIEIVVEERLVEDAPVAPGSWVVLSVRDSGQGMDEVTRAHLFEPFFTTGKQGKGRGLGLAIVYRIVERCGGFIRVESTPGHGTTFLVHLPRVTG